MAYLSWIAIGAWALLALSAGGLRAPSHPGSSPARAQLGTALAEGALVGRPGRAGESRGPGDGGSESGARAGGLSQLGEETLGLGGPRRSSRSDPSLLDSRLSSESLIPTAGAFATLARKTVRVERPTRSRVLAHAVPDSEGVLSKYYYEFRDVRLSEKEVTFFVPDGFVPPPDYPVDVVSGNATSLALPTRLLLKAQVKGGPLRELRVRYVSDSQLSSGPSSPACRAFVSRPSYLLHVRYPTNIWHTWNEGLLGLFQTLRERGLLPLVQVDSDGWMREVLEGIRGNGSVPCSDGIDLVAFRDALAASAGSAGVAGLPTPKLAASEDGVVPALAGAAAAAAAAAAGSADPLRPPRRSGSAEAACAASNQEVPEPRCDTKNAAWCNPGVVSYLRFSEDRGAIALYSSYSAIDHWWNHMYWSLTDAIWDLNQVAQVPPDMSAEESPPDGLCYRRVIIGKTSTLNFYQPADPRGSGDHVRARRDALAIFKAFALSTQVNTITALKERDSEYKPFEGYRNAEMEALRVGVGLDGLDALAALFSHDEAVAAVPHDVAEIDALAGRGRAALRDALQAASHRDEARRGASPSDAVDPDPVSDGTSAAAAASAGAAAGAGAGGVAAAASRASASAAPASRASAAAAAARSGSAEDEEGGAEDDGGKEGAGEGAASEEKAIEEAAKAREEKRKRRAAAKAGAESDAARDVAAEALVKEKGSEAAVAAAAEAADEAAIAAAEAADRYVTDAAAEEAEKAAERAAVAAEAVRLAKGDSRYTSASHVDQLAADGAAALAAEAARGTASAQRGDDAADDATAIDPARRLLWFGAGAGDASGAGARVAGASAATSSHGYKAAAGARGSTQSSDEDDESEAASEEAELAREAAEREAALGRLPRLLAPEVGRPSPERPRPVVTYMCRNFFSRSILNEREVLEYILRRYDVTLRVTTFEEPLLEVMELMNSTDVLLGSHGAGWTNALFAKAGIVALQMFPYGWDVRRTRGMPAAGGDGADARYPGAEGADPARLALEPGARDDPSNPLAGTELTGITTIRGANYREIIYAAGGRYLEWTNARPEYAFWRQEDQTRPSALRHPTPETPRPTSGVPGKQWIYQNTYVDLLDIAPVLDRAMALAGVRPRRVPLLLPNDDPVKDATKVAQIRARHKRERLKRKAEKKKKAAGKEKKKTAHTKAT